LKQVEVTILGQGYILGCPDGGEQLLHAAVSTVDREMSAIRDGGKVKARERIAVLAALNLAYQLAERPAAPAPGSQAAARTTDDDNDGEVDLDALIFRLDAAIGSDGHLL
jgi:cell division protein ZapA